MITSDADVIAFSCPFSSDENKLTEAFGIASSSFSREKLAFHGTSTVELIEIAQELYQMQNKAECKAYHVGKELRDLLSPLINTNSKPHLYNRFLPSPSHPRLTKTEERRDHKDDNSMAETKRAEDSGHNGTAARQLTTVTLTPEQFDTLYLQPRSGAGKRNLLVNNLGNPTPLGITAFLLALFPLSLDLLQLRGATSGSSITLLGALYGVAGIGLYLACIMEWIIGNTFPSVVFGLLGGLWISYAILLQPSFGIAASFATTDEATSSATAAAAGSATSAYNDGVGFYFLIWGIFCLVLFLASLRTNVAFAAFFFFLIIMFELLAAAYFAIGEGEVSKALKELKAAGAFGFVVSIVGVWIDVSLLFASVGCPFTVPLIDLSGVGRSNDSPA
ncbi:hypothetical protein ACEPAF_381 [Sanghuangporus sanghuang]